MAEILQDLAPEALAQAVELNLRALWVERSRLPQIELYAEPGRTWFVSSLRYPGANGVLWADFPSGELDGRIEGTLDLFRARRIPMTWWVGPLSRPAELGQRLQAHGLVAVADEPGMAADLLALSEDVLPPSTLEVRRVGDRQALRQWVGIFLKSFGVPRPMGRVIREIEEGLGLDQESPRQLFLAFLDGKPVATAMLFLGAGVAGLYGVATLPRLRRHGIGTTVTLAALRQARARGYRVAVLHASRAGFSVYRRLGFREYCRVQQFGWEP